MFKRIIMLTICLPATFSLKCYMTDLKGISNSNVKIRTYEVEGYITKAEISKHHQYKVIKEQRLCKPVDNDSCINTELFTMQLRNNKEIEEAIDKGMCLVGKECENEECYEQRAYLCENHVRDRWERPKQRRQMKAISSIFRWVCQTTWSCELKEFESNVQILSIEPLTYRLETPQGGFVVCSKPGRPVTDSMGYYITCPEVRQQTTKTMFHCIQHPERILCRSLKDHAMLDFTQSQTNVIYDTIYHVSNETSELMQDRLNKLGTGTITDLERLMREVEVENLQTILDLSILKDKLYSIGNLVLELLLNSMKGDPGMLGRIMGDQYYTETIRGRIARQCEPEEAVRCDCWKREGDNMKCTNDVRCTRSQEDNNTLKLMGAFADYNLESTLVEDLKFRNKISDLWVDSIREEASRKHYGSVLSRSDSNGWTYGVWSSFMDWLYKNFMSLLSLTLALYSIKLHLRKK